VKIVVISPRFPYPLEKGDKLRLYHQLKVLSKHHEIVLMSLSDVDVKVEDINHLESFVSKVYVFRLSKIKIIARLLLGVFSSKPFQVLYFTDNQIKKEINLLIEKEKPDFILNQLIRTAEYSKDLGFDKVLDYMDSFSQGMKKRQGNSSFPFSYIYNLEYKRLVKYETDIFKYFDRHMIISEQDKNAFDSTIRQDIKVVPNGVDMSFFYPKDYKKKYTISFIGNMGYRPNIIASEFLIKEIYPRLKKDYNDLRILLAGARPHSRVKALANKEVFVSGWLEDIREAYGESKIFVAPLFTGIGQQNKILEAMSMEIPVITTTGVNNAIGAKDGEEILIADDAEEFVKQINRLINDAVFASKLGSNGRKFVKDNYSWDYQGQKVLNLFRK